jgi:hypothetical protein
MAPPLAGTMLGHGVVGGKKLLVTKSKCTKQRAWPGERVGMSLSSPLVLMEIFRLLKEAPLPRVLPMSFTKEAIQS